MKNKIVINMPHLANNRIDISYQVEGEWKEAFSSERNFFVEYSCDISNVSVSLAAVPLLTNILPVSWVYDAEIVIPVCDKAFYDSISNFKKGYIDMYPMLEFKGSLSVENIQENHSKKHGRAASFFSGGVDATDTLIRHITEKPILLSIWGMDIDLSDVDGWNNVLNQLEKVQKEFNVDCITIKSNFRELLDISRLDDVVTDTRDLWVHGFQFGIGILGHAAPIVWKQGISTIYIASNGYNSGIQTTCSSDPSIDNFVRFCDAVVVHDGFEFDRQQKIHNITTYSRLNKVKIQLRVCFGRDNYKGILNCCTCAKCFRTMLGIYAEGEEPRNFGFSYTSNELQGITLKKKFEVNGNVKRDGFMLPIWNAMHSNLKQMDVPKSIKWFYDMKIEELEEIDISESLLKPIHKNGYEHKVLIWSACVKTDKVVEELKKNDIEIFGYVDKKSDKLDFYNGYRVFDKSILKSDRFFVFVGMDSTYHDVIDYLKENNYIEFEDYIYPNS